MTNKITARQLKELWEKHPNEVAEVFTKTLKIYGYTVSSVDVRMVVEVIYKGKTSKVAYAIFLSDWIEHGIEE
jgi:hypothetical protein